MDTINNSSPPPHPPQPQQPQQPPPQLHQPPIYVDGSIYACSVYGGKSGDTYPVMKIPGDTKCYYKFAVLQMTPKAYRDDSGHCKLVIPITKTGDIISASKKDGKVRRSSVHEYVSYIMHDTITDLENYKFSWYANID